jgi:hypothetical protein
MLLQLNCEFCYFFSMDQKIISEAAKRALAEAAARRLALAETTLPQEKGGPKGPEPTRFGDWEKKGITSDF